MPINPKKSNKTYARQNSKTGLKEQETILPLTIPEIEESEDTMSMVSLSSSREIGGELSLERSVRSVQSIPVAKASKIPTKPGTSRSGTPSRTTSSMSNLNINGRPKKSTTNVIRGVKDELQKIVSPRFTPRGECQSARSIHAEFKFIAKKYKSIKCEFAEKDAALRKVRQQLLALYDKMGEAGAEKLISENLKDLQEYIIKRKMSRISSARDEDAQFSSIVDEIQTFWEEIANEVVKSLKEQLVEKSVKFDVERLKGEKVEEAKSLTKQKLEEILQFFTKKNMETREDKALLEGELKNCEDAKRGLEGRIEKMEAENKDLKRILTSERETSERLGKELQEKSSEVEKWIENCNKARKTKEKTIKMAEENEKKLNSKIELLENENRQLSANEEDYKKKIETNKEKLAEVLKRESNLKQVIQTMAVDSLKEKREEEASRKADEARAELEAIKTENENLKKETEELKVLLAAAKDKVESLTAENETKKAVEQSGDGMGDFGESAVEQQMEEDQRAREEAEDLMKKKVQALQDWEQDLSYREDRLGAMVDVNHVKDDLVKILKQREKRRIRASEPNYESLCRIVKKSQSDYEAMQNDLALLQQQEQLHHRQRLQLEEVIVQLQNEVRLHKKRKESKRRSDEK